MASVVRKQMGDSKMEKKVSFSGVVEVISSRGVSVPAHTEL
ncbi:hypothetical protein THF5H11_11419 [Vibrio jasicida]|nr:hypothetical protein THF5H11_11419 [Vibrio jasicida]CAH1604528.1 hypothetical protein THF5G08_10417 [Vibrio jasicida]